MDFDWNALGTVAVVGVVATAVLMSLFCGGIAAMSRRDAARAGGEGGGGAVALGGALACFTVCGAGVLYGLYLIIPQFHG